jgi:hypothetical protein
MPIISERTLPGKQARRGAVTALKTGIAGLLFLTIFGQRQLVEATQSQTGSSSMDITDSGDRTVTMDTTTKSNAFREVLKQMGAGQKPEPKLWRTFVAAQNDGLKTGPKIGEQVPSFILPDQDGKPQSLRELMGPKGLLLIFLRSADW